MPEPYFMKQLHKEREKESQILWKKFKGDLMKFYQWRIVNLKQNYFGDNFVYKTSAEAGVGYVREVAPKYKIKTKAKTKITATAIAIIGTKFDSSDSM